MKTKGLFVALMALMMCFVTGEAYAYDFAVENADGVKLDAGHLVDLVLVGQGVIHVCTQLLDFGSDLFELQLSVADDQQCFLHLEKRTHDADVGLHGHF